MSNPAGFGQGRVQNVPGEDSGAAALMLALAEQRERWRRGERVRVEALLEGIPDRGMKSEALLDLIYNEYLLAQQAGEKPSATDYLTRFPHLGVQLQMLFAVDRAVQSGSGLPLSEAETNPASDAVPALPDLPGYEVLGELGRGGMGVVYRARHLRLGRFVALKMVLHAEHAQQEQLLRFLSEAEAVAQLQHPNIVQLFDSGQHAGVPYFTLELVEGGTLADKLRQNPLTPREAAGLVEQMSRGVHHAHERGILHRDLKPDNVLLASGGREPPDDAAASGGSRPPLANVVPKVADFGLAKRVDVGTALTATGNVLGTPSYMAPEQAGGQGKRLGPAADVYALGAILYECLTGRPPFRAATAVDTLLQVLSDEPLPVRTLAPKCPRDLETICHKCLQKEPHKRYASAQDLADDLRRFENGEPIRARPVGWIERVVKWTRRRPAAAALAAVAVLLIIGTVFGVLLYNRQLRETRAVARAQSLVAALRSADTPTVSHIVVELAEVRDRVAPQLRALLDDPDTTPREKLHASLALLPGDDGQVKYLYGRLLAAEPHEVIVIRDALRPHAETLHGRLWTVLEDVKGDSGQRLRSACALAAYAEEDGRWEKVSRDVMDRLLAENPLVIGQWAKALKPVGRHLLPPLAALVLDEGRGAADRRVLAGLYKDFAEGVADGFVPLEKVLSEQAGAGADPEARLAAARRQANAAVALAAAGRWEKLSPLLRHTPDPTLRSYLIDRLGPGGVEARAVIDRLSPEREPDVSARRALLLALGEFGPDRLLRAEREAMVPQLLGLYRDDPDPGIHGAVGWLLRQWQEQGKVEEIDKASRLRQPPEGRRWYVNGQGQTMVVVPPGEFEMGEGNQRQRVKIERSFALAAREVSVAEFRRFRKDHQIDERYAPTEDCPVNMVSWYDAAAYCNWLSKEEGILEDQWCYVPNEKKEYAEGMKVKANVLSLSGYRLPTEWEWEHACRAGSVTPWSMGEAEDLLGKYAWYVVNSSTRSHPVGLLRPNDWGLFDMHGNDGEWCINKVGNIADTTDPQKEDIVDSKSGRSSRGGTFSGNASDVRSADRSNLVPAYSFAVFGFRPARTFR